MTVNKIDNKSVHLLRCFTVGDFFELEGDLYIVLDSNFEEYGERYYRVYNLVAEKILTLSPALRVINVDSCDIEITY